MMDPTPAINEESTHIMLECSDSEKTHRLGLCKNCDKFTLEENHTKCVESGCLISLMITYTFKQCPLKKW